MRPANGIEMFGWLTRKQRWRAASLLVALYALCLATPTAVVALGLNAIPAHCLTDDHDAGVVHSHHGSAHHHSGGTADHGDHEGKCCGLFGITAIAPEAATFSMPPAPATQQQALIAASLSGRGSERIDRPPRSHLSL